MDLLHAWIGIIALIAMFIWGDWRNWKKYYSTIVFLIAGNMLYNHMVEQTMLWKWTPPYFAHEFSAILWGFTVYPSIALLFIPRYLKQNTIKSKMLTLFFFVAIFTIIEYIIFGLGHISYFYGWKFSWSVLVYFFLFPILIVHHKNPILAWLLFFIIAYSTLYIFGLPLRVLV